MELNELQVLQAVAAERSFSRAAVRLHRTQPAVSQAIRRLEDELGERLFDRSSKGGRLTEAGTILLDYAERLTRLTDEAEGAIRELQELRRGRVVVGVNEAAVHVLLPIVVQFREAHPQAQVEMRRVQSRQIPGEVLNRSLDFGLVTFPPGERGLLSVPLGVDELVMLTHPTHPLARRRQVAAAAADAARLALDQRHSQIALDLAHLPPCPPIGEPHALGRLRQRAALRHVAQELHAVVAQQQTL